MDCHTATFAPRSMRSVRGGIRRARTLSNGSRILSWFGRVASESIHVTCLIRADGGSKLFVEGMPVDCETLQGLRHGHYVVINQQVGYQMVVLDELALLVPNTLGRQRQIESAASRTSPT